MKVVVAGGHGKIGLRLLRQLAARGDEPVGMIRSPDQVPDLEAVGAEAVVLDLEREDASAFATALEGADALVFSAGAGAGSDPARKQTVDSGAAVKLIDACHEAGVSRYVMVSAITTDQPERWSEAMRPYYEAKRAADEALLASGLEHTIVRPGSLTDASGTGAIAVGMPLERSGEVTRDDVAATLVAVLDEPGMVGFSFDLLAGETPIADAIASLAATAQ